MGTKRETTAGGRLFDLTLTGQLSLDLVNTVDWRTSQSPRELLTSYDDLLRWGEHAGALDAREAARLAREAAGRRKEADRVLARAVALRERLFRIFAAAAAGVRADETDLDALNLETSDALSRVRIAAAGEGHAWEWSGEGDDLARVLWPAARAAGELLTSDDLSLLRQCPGEGCGWLFLDTSRNRSRRWCVMEVCGNRAKARRHYEQVRAAR